MAAIPHMLIQPAQASTKPRSSPLDSMLSSLSGLLRDSDDYDEEYLKPTAFAFERMHELLEQSCGFVKRYPLGDVYATGDGGVRCDWKVGDRQMRLIISPETTGRHYVYLQDGDEFGGNDAFSVKQIGDYLNWLTNTSYPAHTLPNMVRFPNTLPSCDKPPIPQAVKPVRAPR